MIRALDKLADQEQDHKLRLEKNLADYQAQASKPFEHEARIKDLTVRQVQLNALLDLDKNDHQVAWRPKMTASLRARLSGSPFRRQGQTRPPHPQ